MSLQIRSDWRLSASDEAYATPMTIARFEFQHTAIVKVVTVSSLLLSLILFSVLGEMSGAMLCNHDHLPFPTPLKATLVSYSIRLPS
jgi:hypothetical protein